MNNLNIGIVTSFYNGYGKYLPQWLESICSLTIKPAAVTIVLSGQNHGLTGMHEKKALKFISGLKKDKIDVRMISLNEHLGMGRARNTAVKLTNTEWIMYLDADDRILPWAIYEISNVITKNKNQIDVVCTGFQMEYNGAIKKIKLFNKPAPSARRVLQGYHCSCSHSPFRKSLWERAPWIERNDLIEQSLWIGFAHLGARFAATERACTVYVRHDDSFMGRVKPGELRFAKEQRQAIARGGIKVIKGLMLDE